MKKRIKPIPIHFIQDDISVSKKHVLRGIHGDSRTWRLVSFLHGMFYHFGVKCCKKSKTFGQWESFILSGKNHLRVLIPSDYGHAHLALSSNAIFHYKQSTYHNPDSQFTYKRNEPQFNTTWPINDPLLSKRDKLGRRV